MLKKADSEKLEKRVGSFLFSGVAKITEEVDLYKILSEYFVHAMMEFSASKELLKKKTRDHFFGILIWRDT